MRSSIFLALMLLIAARVDGFGQQVRPPESGGFTEYLGQPRIWHRHAGAGAGFLFDEGAAQLITEGRFGLYTDLVNPLLGLAGVQAEFYAGARGAKLDYGLRAQVISPFLRLGVGFDLNGLDRDAYALITLFHPIRRGGVFTPGSQLRLNYLPGRENSFSLGLEMPIGRRINMGQTRPHDASANLAAPRAPPAYYPDPEPGLLAAVDTMKQSASWITRLTVPFLEHPATGKKGGPDAVVRDLVALRAHLLHGETEPGSWNPLHEVRQFHAALEGAFSIASGEANLPAGTCTELGKLVADYARTVMLDEILIPYNRLLGQVKQPDTLSGLGVQARGQFIRWLYLDSRVPRERIATNLWVFARLIEILESSRRYQYEQWHDSRFGWLPLQFALLPEQHDSQTELDALIERVTRVRFTDGNRVWYVVNEQFPLQLSRTIHAAQDYHVLWIHDIRGLDVGGNPDEMTYRHVLGAYLGALIQRVKEYDQSGSFPVYMIFLDQWYYELNHSRFWMNLLEDPLRRRLDLPRGFEAWEDTIAAAQEELRKAVSESRLLQDQAAQFGATWLHNLVRVHVSITNPADPSFWRNDLIPFWGLPDNVMRDHRKIAFYDVSEEDPYRGGAIYTGGGVGEHYTTLSWEDRSLVAEGPALLTLKYAARDLLLNQGIAPERIPWSLQPRPLAPDYHDLIRAHADTGRMNARALEVHNQTGYNPKDLNVLKAVLYTMMPAGSVAIVPDGLWSSSFWSGALVGHALRGGRSLIIAPADANAPSTTFGGMIRSQEVLSRIALASIVLRDVVEAQGGLLKVGVYSPSFQVTDLKAKLDAFKETAKQYPWFRRLYDFPPDVFVEFERLSLELKGQNERWQRTLKLEDPGVSKLHLKANFLASKEAWTGLMHQGNWPEALRVFMMKRVWQIENRDAALGRLDAPMPDFIDVGQPMLDAWLAGLSPEERERLVLYLMVGSHNQNNRSMVMDGEAAFLVAGTSINAGLIDLGALTGQVHWIETVDQLAKFYADPNGLQLRLSRWLKLIL